VSHASRGEAGFDGQSVYDLLAQILIEEAERQQREAVKSA
jgi:hypothetical protein